MKIDKVLNEIDEMGDAHAGSSAETPIRKDAFEVSDTDKIALIREDVEHIMPVSYTHLTLPTTPYV